MKIITERGIEKLLDIGRTQGVIYCAAELCSIGELSLAKEILGYWGIKTKADLHKEKAEQFDKERAERCYD